MTQIDASTTATPTRPDPQKIIVPRKHAQLLIEPSLAAAADAVNARTQPLTSDQLDQTFGGNFLALRDFTRRQFVQSARQWAAKTGAAPPPNDAHTRPLILTGHQLEFYHAGVWAKVIAADELAKRVRNDSGRGVAFDLLVDHDIVDQRGFDVPTHHDTTWKRTPIDFASESPIPADGLPAPTPEKFDHWDAALAQHPLTHTDSLAFFLTALNPAHSAFRIPHSAFTYAPWLSSARARFEHAMNLHVHHIPTSLLCTTDAWSLFLCAWIDNADRWTSLYNTHLAAYRKRQGIKNPQHPMPDLARTQNPDNSITFELPFWIYKQGEPRQRLLVTKKQKAEPLLYAGDHQLPLSQFRTHHSEFIIRPRALTLTMFTRLFVADFFIHGIGGALYDQITDALLYDLFGIIPPYNCVSAAWLLPLGQPLEANDDIPALKWRRHHIEHNPQLAIDPFTAVKTDVAEKIRDRRQLIEQITASLAASRNDPAARQQRRTWFHQLHTLNEHLHQLAPRLLANLDHQIEDALRAREQNKVLLWREYFFALHSMESLHKLIEKILSNA